MTDTNAQGVGRRPKPAVPARPQPSEPPKPMSSPPVTSDDFLTFSPRIRVLPIIHGSGDFAIQVREELLRRPYDCVAVPLPPSFQEDVEAAVDRLPTISVVVQRDAEAGETETE